MSIKKIQEELETKEGILLLISQIIKDTPNDQDLGKRYEKTLKIIWRKNNC